MDNGVNDHRGSTVVSDFGSFCPGVENRSTDVLYMKNFFALA